VNTSNRDVSATVKASPQATWATTQRCSPPPTARGLSGLPDRDAPPETWPRSSPPQHSTHPLDVTAAEWAPPHATATTRAPTGKDSTRTARVTCSGRFASHWSASFVPAA
jgi:hypothetical protein